MSRMTGQGTDILGLAEMRTEPGIVKELLYSQCHSAWHTDHKDYTEAGVERKDMRRTVNLLPVFFFFLREEGYCGLIEFVHR